MQAEERCNALRQELDEAKHSHAVYLALTAQRFTEHGSFLMPLICLSPSTVVLIHIHFTQAHKCSNWKLN